MQWKYDSTVQEHQLNYNKTVLARIQTTPLKHGGFKVITLISGIYFGMKRQLALEKQKKQWVAYRKRLLDREQVNLYIGRKKEAVQKFIEAREKEG
jgi:hypothetical protein